MNATILPFKRVQKPIHSRLGKLWDPKDNVPFDGSIPFLGLPAENPGPSLEEMCATLRKNYAVLDETGRRLRPLWGAGRLRGRCLGVMGLCHEQ